MHFTLDQFTILLKFKIWNRLDFSDAYILDISSECKLNNLIDKVFHATLLKFIYTVSLCCKNNLHYKPTGVISLFNLEIKWIGMKKVALLILKQYSYSKIACMQVYFRLRPVYIVRAQSTLNFKEISFKDWISKFKTSYKLIHF